jgi:hypothetical protein
MQRRDALPSPRRQEQRQPEPRQQQQYQQQQPQRPPPICYKFNTPGGCTNPNCRFQHVEANAPAAPAPSQRGGAKGQRADDRTRQIGRDQVSFIGTFDAADTHAANIQIAPLETAETIQFMNDALLCTVVDKEANLQRLSLLRDEEAPYADAVEALAMHEAWRQQEQADFDLAITGSLRPRKLICVVDTAAGRTITSDTVAPRLGAPTMVSDVTLLGIAPTVVKATHQVMLSIVTEQEDAGKLICFPPLRVQGTTAWPGKSSSLCTSYHGWMHATRGRARRAQLHLPPRVCRRS